MTLSRKRLCKAVRGHLGCRYPANKDLTTLDFLTKPVMMNVNVFELSLEDWLFFLKKSDSLLIVA
jgi:hypothetical protein